MFEVLAHLDTAFLFTVHLSNLLAVDDTKYNRYTCSAQRPGKTRTFCVFWKVFYWKKLWNLIF